MILAFGLPDQSTLTPFTYSASVVATAGTVTETSSANFTGTIGVYTNSGGTSLYNGVAAVAITNTTSGSVSVGPGLPTTVFVVIKDASNAIVGDVRSTILGIAGASTVNGTGASEIIFGFEAASTINAGGGNNLIIGGTGVDNITTGNGNNVIQNGAGAGAGAGDDVITTGRGNDIITSGAGVKTINSGAGADIFVWASADVDTTAGAVIDTINDYGTAADSIRGSWGVGSAANYFNNPSAAADLAGLLLAADTKLDGTIKYYVGQVGADSYLVTDSDGIGYTDVIKLVGFGAVSFAVGQIVA